jgi:hypothetical protein
MCWEIRKICSFPVENAELQIPSAPLPAGESEGEAEIPVGCWAALGAALAQPEAAGWARSRREAQSQLAALQDREATSLNLRHSADLRARQTVSRTLQSFRDLLNKNHRYPPEQQQQQQQKSGSVAAVEETGRCAKKKKKKQTREGGGGGRAVSAIAMQLSLLKQTFLQSYSPGMVNFNQV